MIQEGVSSPADLMVLPLLFLVAFLLVSAVFAVWRRWTGRGRGEGEERDRRPMGVLAAVGHLRAAGIDPDALLGPWLMEARRGLLMEEARQARNEESTLKFN